MLLPACELVSLTFFNICAANEHLGNIERSVCVVKERTCCQVHRLSYKRLLTLLVEAMATNATDTLNLFPPKEGLSKLLAQTPSYPAAHAPVSKAWPLNLERIVKFQKTLSPLIPTLQEPPVPSSSP